VATRRRPAPPAAGYDRAVDKRHERPDETIPLRERVEALKSPRVRLVEGDPDVTTVIFVGEPEEPEPDEPE
jgi:hypothetical protein